MLLPYIDDKNNFELFKKITKLNDIYIFKKDDMSERFIYEISNIQYNRCNIINVNNKLEYEEEYFKLEYLEQNFSFYKRLKPKYKSHFQNLFDISLKKPIVNMY
jgi:hypothetical protein